MPSTVNDMGSKALALGRCICTVVAVSWGLGLNVVNVITSWLSSVTHNYVTMADAKQRVSAAWAKFRA